MTLRSYVQNAAPAADDSHVSGEEARPPIDEFVRLANSGNAAAAEHLNKLGDPAALPALLAALPDTSGHSTRVIINALGRIGGDEAAAALAQFLDPFFHAPGRHAPDDALTSDEYRMDADHKNDRRLAHWLAAEALRKIRTPLALDMLAVNNCPWQLARACVIAKAPDPAHAAVLRKAQAAAKHRQGDFVYTVARLRCGDASALDDLRVIATDDTHPDRDKAQRRLERDPHVHKLLRTPPPSDL